MAGLAATLAIAHSGTQSVRAGLGYSISYVRELAENAVETPNEYSYELVQFRDGSVLRFDDDRPEHRVFVFGDNNPEVTPIEDGGEIDLPMQLDFEDMEQATAFFLSGVMAILLGATAVFKNPAAGVMWSVSFVLLIVAGLFGFGLELFWMGILMTIVLVMIGMVVRWT